MSATTRLRSGKSGVRTALFDYRLPPERIAQEPIEPRDSARLLVAGSCGSPSQHQTLRDFPDLLQPGDLVVVNDTRVLAARVFGRKPSGGRVEMLLLRHLGPGRWLTLVSPGRRVPEGTEIVVGSVDLVARVEARFEDGSREIRLCGPASPDDADLLIQSRGEVPLPPYITSRLSDPERYQTVYASTPGSAAAPTAGLHFTPELLARVQDRGVEVVTVTLHVGLATFRPIRCDEIDQHEMHEEHFVIPANTAAAIAACRGRVVAIGTTTVRCLEAAARGYRSVAPGSKSTALYITPGYHFKIVDALLTNFHMPRSSLLVMVSAFAGRERIMAAYGEALAAGYRFLSFGDGMFLQRSEPG